MTIGYGHRVIPGQPLIITQQQADEYFIADTMRILVELWKDSQALKTYEVDALVSFIYNIGIGAWRGSTAHRDMALGYLAKIPYEMERWVHDDRGDVIPGLVTRRAKEAARFKGVLTTV